MANRRQITPDISIGPEGGALVDYSAQCDTLQYGSSGGGHDAYDYFGTSRYKNADPGESPEFRIEIQGGHQSDNLVNINLEPLVNERVDFQVQHDGTAANSATNPLITGTGVLLPFNEGEGAKRRTSRFTLTIVADGEPTRTIV